MKSKRQRTQRNRSVSLADLPWEGDHGTGTQAATQGTHLAPLRDENGKPDPNRRARRQRVNRLESLSKRDQITLRQYQAGVAIQNAYSAVEKLDSGGELKERVQSTPDPDAPILQTIEAVSQRRRVINRLTLGELQVVEAVCIENMTFKSYSDSLQGRVSVSEAGVRFRDALDKIADNLRY